MGLLMEGWRAFIGMNAEYSILKPDPKLFSTPQHRSPPSFKSLSGGSEQSPNYGVGNVISKINIIGMKCLSFSPVLFTIFFLFLMKIILENRLLCLELPASSTNLW